MRPEAVPVGASASQSLRIHAEVDEVTIDAELRLDRVMINQHRLLRRELRLRDAGRKAVKSDYVHVVGRATFCELDVFEETPVEPLEPAHEASAVEH